MERPSREDVYESWLRVQRLEDELQKAKAEHQRLSDARYKDNAEQLRADKIACGVRT